MTLARMCGLEVADVRYELAGSHEIVLVKRFDRKIVDGGVQRSLFASAATVLRLRSDQTPEDPDRSYVKLAYELQRWCGDENQSFAEQQRELWRRMAFNALVGNYDDHPRNHGLLYRNGSWTLAPAYDVVAFPRRRGVQAMAVNRAGGRTATPESLVVDAGSFSFTASEAWDALQTMAHTVHSSWRQLYIDRCGMSEENLEGQRPAFELAEQIATGVIGLDPARFERRSRRKAR
jgi:serine/threonine-protein kinase HipA